jgi:tRNA dimethylallyltransferase
VTTPPAPGTGPVAGRPVLAVVGTTASGKTALSLPLAEALGGEIVSMDSRQVYRGMDIGTDKVLPEERARVPHHGLDLVEPRARYSAGRFARDARRWIDEIRARGHLPLLVGGTGFFLKALLEPVFQEPPMDPDRREALRRALARLPPEEPARWVRRLDPARAELALAGGAQRTFRTLEVALLTGRPLSWWHAHAPPDAPPVSARIVRLLLPREESVRRIDARVVRMFDRGLPAEVDRLLQAGADPADPGMTGTGYREAADVLLGRSSLEEAILRTQRATRAYARRQDTWFRHQLPPGVLELDALLPVAEQVERVLRWWEAAPEPAGPTASLEGKHPRSAPTSTPNPDAP